MPATGEGEFCDQCGTGPLPPWSAPNGQWNSVTEHPDSEVKNGRGAILCLACFADAASLAYGLGITARVELHQKRCATHGYWPPCPESSTYDQCDWKYAYAEFSSRLQGARLDQG